jgi:hypothetical protein
VRLAFVIPVHGRHQLAEACLRQLARTCLTLNQKGVDAAAILVGDDAFFGRLATELGFGWVRAANRPLGAKWNEGIEFACREGAVDYVVPLGSDDVVDASLFVASWPSDAIVCARESAVVSPDGDRLAELHIGYGGGDGVRMLPSSLLERVGFRPAADERDRAIDGSMSDKLGPRGTGRPARYVYRGSDARALQIIDFKSSGRGQRNTYEACLDLATAEHEDVWERVGSVYPAAFVEEIRACYRERVAA